jgi:hypothetical protein
MRVVMAVLGIWLGLQGARASQPRCRADKKRRRFIVQIAMLSALITLSTTQTYAAVAEGWKRFSNGADSLLSGPINSSVFWDDGSGPAWYAAGFFSHAGSLEVNSIARWNGAAWSPLQGGLTQLGSQAGVVNSLAIYQGKLVAAGVFANAGGVSANNLAAWDGQAWTPLGTGVNAGVGTIKVFDGLLYVGGSFSSAGGQPTSKLATWNGTFYRGFGLGLSNVGALEIFNGALYIANGQTITRLNALNEFESVAGGSHTVRALFTYQGALYAGGSFTSIFANAASVDANGVAKFDGTNWSALGAGVTALNTNAQVNALGSYNNELMVGGSFVTAGGQSVKNIARWNGATWQGLAQGLEVFGAPNESNINGIFNVGTDLVLSGNFDQASGSGAKTNVRWNGSQFALLGEGFNGWIRSAIVFNGQPVVVGKFTQSGSEATNHVARWDGSRWRAMGVGFNREVRTLTIHNNELVVAGAFSALANGTPMANVARWNGTAWVNIGNGLNANTEVTSITSFDNKLFAAGGATGMSVWDGTSWSGIPRFGDQFVIYQNQLYSSSLLGVLNINVLSTLARWNGTAWTPITGSPSDIGTPSVVYNNRLVLRGAQAFDGTTWASLSAPCPSATAAGVNDGKLYLTQPGLPTYRYNGSQWQAVPNPQSGPFPVVPEMLAYVSLGNDLLVGGQFTNLDNGGAGPNIAALGNLDSTVITVMGTNPITPQDFQSVTITAQVSATISPLVGQVTIDGSPSGSCTDQSLTPINATTSEASCTITFKRGGSQQLRARYSGASSIAGAWRASNSPAFPIMVISDFLFCDGFEAIEGCGR